MIHHISIPAQNPLNVAKVLAELTQGRAYPFPAAPQSYIVFMPDNDQGLCIEIYPDQVEIIPGSDEQQARVRYKNQRDLAGDFQAASAGFKDFHAAISVPLSWSEVQAIARRENWRVLLAERGAGSYQMIELWVENHLLLEILTPEMMHNYTAFLNPQNWEQFFDLELCFKPSSQSFNYRSRSSKFSPKENTSY